MNEAARLLTFSIFVFFLGIGMAHWSDIKPLLSKVSRWVRYGDTEQKIGYGVMSFALVVGVVWGISLL